MSMDNKAQTHLLDPGHAFLNGQAKVNAEIFTAVEILGRKLERVEAERDRLARRLALIESAATLDEKTGKFYLPVVVDRDEPPAPAASSPRWMVAASLMSSAVALFALGLVLFREPAPTLTKDQIAALNALSGTQFAQLSSENRNWKDLSAAGAAPSSTPSPSATLPDNTELAKLEQSAETLNNVEPAATSNAPAAPPAPSVSEAASAPIDLQNAAIPGEDKAADIASVAKAPETPVEKPAVKTAAVKPKPATVAEKTTKPVVEAKAVAAKPGDIAPDTTLTGKVAELEKRAYEGVPEAQHDLATLYASGKLVTQDYTRAAFWFNKAAENGVANAHYNLGVIYHQGLGVPVDLTKALQWYEKAAELGHPEAMYNLGIAYIEGIGTKADTEKGVSYFKRAAKAGVAQAAYNLGVLYESNFIGPIDLKKAAEWYRAAAKQGHEEAKNALKRLNVSGPGSVAAADSGDQAMTLAETVEPAAGNDEETGEGDSSPASESRPAAPAPAKKPRGTLADIQDLLIKQGILPGRADGVMSQQTEDAIRSAQRKLGMTEDGQPSQELLEKLLQKPPLAQ